MGTASTSSLARRWNIEPKELFERLSQLELIERSENRWVLTEKGIEAGGQMQEGVKSGEYIIWSEELSLSSFQTNLEGEFLSIADKATDFDSSTTKVKKSFSAHEKKLISTARKLQVVLAKHGSSRDAKAQIRSEDMMRIAILYGVYPPNAKWGFKQANWDNGAPVRKLVFELNEIHLLSQVFPSCRFEKSASRFEDNKYFFMPKHASKLEEKLLSPKESSHSHGGLKENGNHYGDALGLVGTLTTMLTSFIAQPNEKDGVNIKAILHELSRFVDETDK